MRKIVSVKGDDRRGPLAQKIAAHSRSEVRWMDPELVHHTVEFEIVSFEDSFT